MTEVSNPGKIMFPDAGLTKRDLVSYYERVAERMTAHVAGRPLTLHRFPSGISSKGFMQKNAGRHFPEGIERFEVAKREGGTTVYPVVRDPASIPYLANQGTIAFHVWTTTVTRPHHPDRIIFDLDPPEGDTAAARRAAHLVCDALAALEIPTVPMTTGSHGYHVVAAIEPTVHIDRAADFSRKVAELLAREHSDALTTEFRIDNRRGRVFVDWLRNTPSQTGIAPWSLRARAHAPAAVPITWQELALASPDHWRLTSIDERLDRPDPLADLAGTPVSIGHALERVDDAAGEAGIELEPFDRFRS